jgi:hypothetical protein
VCVPHNDERASRVGQAGTASSDATESEHDGIDHPRAILVAEGADDDAEKNGRRDAGNVGVADVALGQAQVLFDTRHEGGEGEPGREGNEESKP